MIFLLNDKKGFIDVKEKLAEELTDNRSIFGNAHVYIASIKWLNDDKVLLKIHGYGDVDPKGFAMWYEYSIGGNSIKEVQSR